MKPKLLLLAVCTLAIFAGAHNVSAATLQISTNRTTLAIGDQFTVDVKVDSEGIGINAAQATIQVPADIVQIVSADKAGSVFNFWIADPVIASDGSKVTFVGGSTSGFSGKSLQILRILLKVRGSGRADIVFTDGAVTVNDGTGANVLSAMQGASITSSPTGGVAPSTPSLPAQPEQPKQLTRTATKATGLPARPQIQVPLYPDPQKWYNNAIPFAAHWDLPSDIMGVATGIDKNPAGLPTRSEGLFDNKQFTALNDGIWYLHVQFKNNIGWGAAAHYRIAIDTAPPIAFTPTFDQGTSTDNPTPTIHFKSGDSAGIARYYIQIDNGNQSDIQPDTYTLPPQEPGEHTIRIGAEDHAGNTTEDRIIVRIIPIASPVIAYVNKDVYIGENNVQINGSTAASTTVRVILKNKGGQVLTDAVSRPDANGTWREQLNQGLPSGEYYFEIRAVDGRGALSLPVRSDIFSVSVKPFLTIGSLQLSIGWFLGLIIVLLLAITGSVWSFWRMKREQQSRKITMCQRDITNVLTMAKKDIDKIIEKYVDDKISETEISEIKYLAKKASATIEKSGKYCIDSIGEINK